MMRSRGPFLLGRGFSLIELLVVMAIIGILAAVTIPAMNSIKGASNVTKAAYDIAGALEQARAYAMAKNTYVFVGIAEVDSSNRRWRQQTQRLEGGSPSPWWPPRMARADMMSQAAASRPPHGQTQTSPPTSWR